MIVDLALYRDGRRTVLSVAAPSAGEAVDVLVDHLAADVHIALASTEERTVFGTALHLEVERARAAYNKAVQRAQDFDTFQVLDAMEAAGENPEP